MIFQPQDRLKYKLAFIKKNTAYKMSTNLKMISKNRNLIFTILNVVFIICIMFWIKNNINLSDLITSFNRISIKSVFVAMAMNIFVLYLYSLRLSLILGKRLFPCFIITNIGFTANSLAPFRLGEAIKILHGNQKYEYSLGALGAAVIIEKLYDLCAIVTLSFLTIFFTKNNFVDLKSALAMLLILSFFICLLLFIRFSLENNASNNRIYDVRIVAWLKKLLHGQEITALNHNMIFASLTTSLIWTTNIFLIFILFKDQLTSTDFTILEAVKILLIAALAIAIPAGPAALGVFETGLVAYLTNFYAINNEQALSIALTYHFSITMPHTVIILIYLFILLVIFTRKKIFSFYN